MIRTIRENKLILAVVVASLLNLLGGGLSVLMSWQARQDNCERTHESIADAFQLLGERLGAEQAEIDSFLAELDPITNNCS